MGTVLQMMAALVLLPAVIVVCIALWVFHLGIFVIAILGIAAFVGLRKAWVWAKTEDEKDEARERQAS